MYVCSCFGITEQQVREHAEAGSCTPRQIASASKAGTDCGSCVRRIQGILGRGGCPRRESLERGERTLEPAQAPLAPSPATAAPAFAAVTGTVTPDGTPVPSAALPPAAVRVTAAESAAA